MHQFLSRLTLLSLAILTFTACQTASETSEIITSETIAVENSWGRPSPMAAENGVFYMDIINRSETADSLIGASSDACEVTELHEGYMKENGAMGMRPVANGRIDVSNGQTVNLKPGGLHVMCIGKKIPFDAGTEITLNLTFEQAGDQTIIVPIQEQ